MEPKGFFALLFDLSFNEFITTKIIKILYVLGIIVSVLAAIGIIVSGFAQGAVSGIIMLLLSPIIFLIYVIMMRVWLEVLIVIFRICENTSKMVGSADAAGTGESQ